MLVINPFTGQVLNVNPEGHNQYWNPDGPAGPSTRPSNEDIDALNRLKFYKLGQGSSQGVTGARSRISAYNHLIHRAGQLSDSDFRTWAYAVTHDTKITRGDFVNMLKANRDKVAREQELVLPDMPEYTAEDLNVNPVVPEAKQIVRARKEREVKPRSVTGSEPSTVVKPKPPIVTTPKAGRSKEHVAKSLSELTKLEALARHIEDTGTTDDMGKLQAIYAMMDKISAEV